MEERRGLPMNITLKRSERRNLDGQIRSLTRNKGTLQKLEKD